MEVILARLDALRRRGPESLPALRTAFASATELLKVPLKGRRAISVYPNALRQVSKALKQSVLFLSARWRCNPPQLVSGTGIVK